MFLTKKLNATQLIQGRVRLLNFSELKAKRLIEKCV